MPAPDPQPNRAARRAAGSGASSERRYPDPRRTSVPVRTPRQWAMRRH